MTDLRKRLRRQNACISNAAKKIALRHNLDRESLKNNPAFCVLVARAVQLGVNADEAGLSRVLNENIVETLLRETPLNPKEAAQAIEAFLAIRLGDLPWPENMSVAASFIGGVKETAHIVIKFFAILFCVAFFTIIFKFAWNALLDNFFSGVFFAIFLTVAPLYLAIIDSTERRVSKFRRVRQKLASRMSSEARLAWWQRDIRSTGKRLSLAFGLFGLASAIGFGTWFVTKRMLGARETLEAAPLLWAIMVGVSFFLLGLDMLARSNREAQRRLLVRLVEDWREDDRRGPDA